MEENMFLMGPEDSILLRYQDVNYLQVEISEHVFEDIDKLILKFI